MTRDRDRDTRTRELLLKPAWILSSEPTGIACEGCICLSMRDAIGHLHLGGDVVLWLCEDCFTGLHRPDPEVSRG